MQCAIQAVLDLWPFIHPLFKIMAVLEKWTHDPWSIQWPHGHVIKIWVLGSLAALVTTATLSTCLSLPLCLFGHPKQWYLAEVEAGSLEVSTNCHHPQASTSTSAPPLPLRKNALNCAQAHHHHSTKPQSPSWAPIPPTLHSVGFIAPHSPSPFSSCC